MKTFRETLKDLKCDYQRRVKLERCHHFFAKMVVWVKPGMVGVVCYRFSSYLIHTRFRIFCRIFLLIEHVYSRNEISPYAEIGAGLVLGDSGAVGIIEEVVVGNNCTFLGFNTLTMNQVSGVDFTVDKIIVGNHCVFGSRAKIMRPVNVEDGAQVKDNSVLMFSVKKKGSMVSGVPAKRRRIDNYEDIVNWNPFLGGVMGEG